jgi:hypothetical protein
VEFVVEVTLTLPDDLAARLRPVADLVPRILELGLRELHASAPLYEGLSDVLEVLARLPSPDEVLALRPSPALQERIEELLARNRSSGLSDEECRDWEQYQYVEHLVRVAKARAMLKRDGN